MSARLGSEAVLGYNTTGIGAAGSATYTVADNARDVTFNASRGEADVSTRGTQGWRAKIPTLREGELTVDLIWNPGDPFFDAVQDSNLNGTVLGMAILDGPIATGNGFEADMVCLGFEWGQQLEEGQLVNATLSVTQSDNPPRFVTNGAGAP